MNPKRFVLCLAFVGLGLGACGSNTHEHSPPTTDECDNPLNRPEHMGEPGHDHEAEMRCWPG
jgi:hypothetical protein